MRISTHLHFKLLVAILFVIGIALTFYQVKTLNTPLTPSAETSVWTVEAKVQFQPENNKPIKAELTLPSTYQDNMKILNEKFISRNYGYASSKKDGQRTVTWSIRRAKGLQALYYHFVVHQQNQPGKITAPTQATEPYPFISSQKVAADALLAPIRQKSADIASFTHEAIRLLNQKGDHNAELLLKGADSPLKRAVVITRLLSLAKIPTKVVYGIYLLPGTTQPIPWIASFNGEKWLYFNPVTASQGLPDNMMLWSQGEQPLLQISGAKQAKVTFTVSESHLNALTFLQPDHAEKATNFINFTLLSLPLQTQDVYKILMTVPIGVLVILLLRSFIGVTTLGTFMPVLIALAFRETHVLWGVILFVLVTSIGLLARSYLNQLHLLLVPRLAVILTLVVLMMAMISIFSYRLGFERGLSIALFPMVILTMTIERISILWDERGPQEALIAATGSLITAVLAFIVMTNSLITYWAFAFPGLTLIIIAFMLLIGRYTGYRLSELLRFKAFASKS
ncbi:inactive transglutaminase family protein [Piscirickettsia litoralis]|uniref:Transglutaminase n=1 Tax=Piscirickettsia litoralis TaxID=1891921 RepID=A0ABX3A5J7_9GAMM|nr:inactive transglutaminase family protein [Piscirickettsia litoralis]ODN42710.1 transglutaminase [Piscirickettsia litoralis]